MGLDKAAGSWVEFGDLGHRKDGFDSASYIRARARGGRGKLGFIKLGWLLKLGFSRISKYHVFSKIYCFLEKHGVFVILGLTPLGGA